MARFKILMMAAFVMSTLTVLAQQKTENILFDYDAYTLKKSEQEKLKQISQLVSENKVVKINISGHTDSDGSDNYNNKLSKQRAETIYNFLASNGIDRDILNINYFGENRPISSNATADGMQQNRRVEISIEYTKDKIAGIEETENESKSLFGKNAVYRNVFDEFDKPSQSFRFDASKEQLITAEEGTVINIPKKAFVDKYNNPIKGEVKFQITEYYKNSDIVLNNLTTSCFDKMLETGGMLYLSASSNGEEVYLAEGKSIDIDFAMENLPADMEIFLGSETSNGVNWLPQGKLFNSDMALIRTKKMGTSEYRYAIPLINKKQGPDGGLFAATKLGWINCDRFNDSPKIDMIVDINADYKPQLRMIFKTINGIMPGYSDDKGNARFIQVPVGKKVTILAFSIVDDVTYYSMKEVVIKRGEIVKMEMQSTTLHELEKLVATLD